MIQRFALAMALSVLVVVSEAGAQTGTRLALHYDFATGAFTAAQPSPILGSVNRSAIPNEYLEVSVARGTIHIEGGASDKVEWSLVARDWNIFIRPDTGGAHRPIVAAENPGFVGTATWRDRFTVDLKLNPAARASLHADVQLKVPHDLKLLHVIVHGEGDVTVDNFGGELTVTADSGGITGTNLSGPVLLESRNGGITLDLAQSPFQLGPINLLAHNGTIGLLLPAHPSVTLDLNANCGVIDYGELENEPRLPAGAASTSGAAAQELDCSLRPKSLPPLLGVVHLHNSGNFSVGGGALRIRGMALQGDINLKTKSDVESAARNARAAAGTVVMQAPAAIAHIKVSNRLHAGDYVLNILTAGQCLVGADSTGFFRMQLTGTVSDGQPAMLLVVTTDARGAATGTPNMSGTFRTGPAGPPLNAFAWDWGKSGDPKTTGRGSLIIKDAGETIEATFSGELADKTPISGTVSCQKVRRRSN